MCERILVDPDYKFQKIFLNDYLENIAESIVADLDDNTLDSKYADFLNLVTFKFSFLG